MLSPTILKVYDGTWQNSGPRNESRSILLDEVEWSGDDGGSEEESVREPGVSQLSCSSPEKSSELTSCASYNMFGF